MEKTKTGAKRRGRLDFVKKEEMLAILIRNKDAFDQARDNLKARHLKDNMGDAYALVWKVVLKLHDKFGSLPARGTLVAELHNEMKENPNAVVHDELEKVDEFVEYAFDDAEHGENLAKSKAHYQVAVDTCNQFLVETKLMAVQETLIQDDTVPVDAVAELDRIKTELEVTSSMTDVELEKPFPDGWDNRGDVRLYPTGCDILDSFMGGGWRRREVILFMGPYGSCKTTLVCHAVAESVKKALFTYQAALSKWKKKGKAKGKPKPKKPVVVLIFTEGDKDTYRCRILSHMARVPWRKLTTMKSLKTLSTSPKPGSEKYVDANNIGTEYEKDEFAEAIAGGTGFMPERQRVDMAVANCNEHLLLIDCTDSEDSPRQIGKGGIPELAGIIRAYFRKHPECEPYSFWLDHASALANRMMRGATDDKKLHLVLNEIPLLCADRLAKPFNAPVAIMHQLTGDANKRGPTAKVSHADGANSSSIGEYVDFAVVTGKPDEEGHCVFRVTKHRREPPQSFKIVKIQGNYNRLLDDSDHYTVYPGGTSIVKKSEASKTDAFKQAKALLGNGGLKGGEGLAPAQQVE